MAKGIRGSEARYGWAFTAPAILIIGVFLVLPILLALYVSFGDWNGLGSPLQRNELVGADNYAAILVESGLAQRDFGLSLRNNFFYVLLVVPLQTALALFLAVQVNRRVLRGRGFFRTAFYFPSVTSSIAITTIFLWLFLGSGAVNATLAVLGVDGPNWMADSTGLIHGALAGLGVAGPPEALAGAGPLGLTWWDWLSGPSVAMTVLIIMAVFTTSGTFMLLFLAALQNISGEIDEAASIDGAGSVRKFFSVTLPMLKPTLFTVLTLGLIGTWQVFDQVYLIQDGDPGKTTLTPAYLAFLTSFRELNWGEGAAISFILFGIIVAFTLLQRFVLRDRDRGRGGVRRAEKAVARLQADAEAAKAGAAPVAREGGRP
ncbi:carbohydrate ABC transporter permease [Homoserinibacter sp. YIM 151385]|uniref:carbohydrate ABC transporter permease n=1 Tax=Homoserinibacter sp. YIM 151385 TaxID=2985506 RepID=UPI0022EFEA52|nr:sugar ABC transporter permease [Homoserinibacter sp. YIM 151385]WBU37394.1 sugar ABC transporter permease [Homoserinibacter sp. YIM 151385]